MDYTKGGWRIEEHPVQGHFIGNGEISIASIHEVGNNEAEANAHLISAAPDMYEALKRLYRLMAKDCGGCIKTEITLLEAQEAIAKAEGK